MYSGYLPSGGYREGVSLRNRLPKAVPCRGSGSILPWKILEIVVFGNEIPLIPRPS